MTTPTAAAAAGSALELRGLRKRYGRRTVLDGLHLVLPTGQFSVVLGPPAGGKSVLMRLLIGLEQPDAGQIFFRGEDVTARTAGERYFGYVPQSFALYPHYTVFENIAYPLTLARHDPADVRRRVHELAARLHIDHLLEKPPHRISGGEKQRVALARGVIRDAAVYVLDDPLVGLDFKLREQLFTDLRDALAASAQGSGSTFVYATSDPLETLAMADQVFVLDGGRIVDGGPVDELYERPGHLRALQLLGYPSANLFPGTMESGDGSAATVPAPRRCRTALGSFVIAAEPPEDVATATLTDGQAVTVGVRPEHLTLVTSGPATNTTAGGVDDGASDRNDGGLTFTAAETLREDLGAEQLLYLEAAGLPLVASWTNPRSSLPERGNYTVHVPPAALAVFDPATGRRLGRGTASTAAAPSSVQTAMPTTDPPTHV